MVCRILLTLILCGAQTVFAQVPVTGRAQLMSFPRAAVHAVAAQAYRQELGQLRAQDMLDTDPDMVQRVRRVSAGLIAQAIKFKPVAAHWSWEVHVTSDPQISAYSRAGGKLLVSSHFIDFYHLNDKELAVALAHEIAHVLAEHVGEQISRAAALNPPPPNMVRTVADVIDSMESDITVFLRLQSLSRLQEMEADDIGIELAARAGVAPETIVSFYVKLARTDPGQSLFDTHGGVRQRVEFVQSMAQYARSLYEASLLSRRASYTFVRTSN
jgi:predicted Zn-dependent protease